MAMQFFPPLLPAEKIIYLCGVLRPPIIQLSAFVSRLLVSMPFVGLRLGCYLQSPPFAGGVTAHIAIPSFMMSTTKKGSHSRTVPPDAAPPLTLQHGLGPSRVTRWRSRRRPPGVFMAPPAPCSAALRGLPPKPMLCPHTRIQNQPGVAQPVEM